MSESVVGIVGIRTVIPDEDLVDLPDLSRATLARQPAILQPPPGDLARHRRERAQGLLRHPQPLIDSLEEARTAGDLNRRLKILSHPALLIVDEIGYLPVTQSGATLFFQLVNRRYEHASTVLTSNKGFEEWGRVLGDEVMAAALLDRLLHRCHIVNIRGNSYRMRRHADLSKAIRPGAARDVSPPGATAS
ncbi:ATP-binding protein [Candidatus Palauibacter sp.]|uniref:ATP-binding protein n=1 Tax=Candidatus Palauibacter sp. TaxID=3101350 RepID=UPI003B028D89